MNAASAGSPMTYVSTRGSAPTLQFDDVLLAGLAVDGGLYVPSQWPTMPLLSGSHYADLAATIMWPFVEGTIERNDFDAMCREAYATFRHPSVCPLVQLDDDQWLCELFWGPTLAFKDVALQLVGRLFDHVLARRSERITIVAATSGDTGSAAIDGVKDCANVDIVVLYPAGRVSEVQRRQMTTVDAPGVRTLEVDGTFDDCQDLVKAMFADEAFRTEVNLSAVNSINWARVMAQVVYYVTSARSIGAGGADRPVRFSVPTGNFGNVLAGWVASTMGLNVDRLIIGSNTNDILTRWLNTGAMTMEPVVPTLSPSMDIAISSNAERLLFELNDRDGGLTAEQLQRFRAVGSVSLEPDQRTRLTQQFAGGRLDDEGTIAEMRRVYRATGQILDPHSAVGTAVAHTMGLSEGIPTITMATAHPAKFPGAVERAIGQRPALPDHIADLFERPEINSAPAPNDLVTIQNLVRSYRRS
jgi:threonine synthase